MSTWMHDSISKLNGIGLFVGGNLSGAIISLTVDRLYRRIEKRREGRIKVRIIGSMFKAIGEEEGVNFSVTNLSEVALPEYKIILFHPDRGSISMFDANSTGPLLPEQTREHRVTLMRNHQPMQMIKSWLDHIRHEKLSDPTGDGVLFRLQMKDSKRILYENRKMGETLVNLTLSDFKHGSIGHWAYEESLALQDIDRKYAAEQRKLNKQFELLRQSKGT